VKDPTTAISAARPSTDCQQTAFQFQALGAREVVADFTGGTLSSDGGAPLLRQLDRSLRLTAGLAACFRDERDPRYVEHTLPELLRQRVMAIALGYEDVNDHAALRRDPLLALAAGKPEPLGPARAGAALAAPATLQRLETTVDHAASRYHKIVPLTGRIEAYLLQQAVRTLSRWQREVILDLDATHDPLHGRQEGRFFHGYYDCYCYLPLYGFIGDALCWAQLRTADRDGADGALAALQRIVAAVRQRCRKTRIILRADSGFCREDLLAWCEAHGVDYLVGLARNARLTAQLEPALARARERAILCGGTARVYADFEYRTLDSWSRARRVLGKAERLGDKDNPRFVVTTLAGEPGALYEHVYCARGEMENRVKEQQIDLFGERLSCHGFASNQLRLWLAAFAYVLMERLRAVALRGTALAQATAGTIRVRLLKLAARVEVTVRRVRIRLASAAPVQALFAQVWRQLPPAPG
jgi:hypothetical protein